MAPATVETATLWIFGQPYNYAGHALQRREDYRLQVNDDPSQVISFDVGLVFSDQTLIYQWVRFDIPTSWLVQTPAVPIRCWKLNSSATDRHSTYTRPKMKASMS